MRYVMLFIVALLIFGCGGVKEVTNIKPKIIHPPIIADTLQSTWIDSLFIGMNVKGQDTVTMVKFVPDSALRDAVKVLIEKNKKLGVQLKSLGRFQLKVKPDSIILMDTVQIVKPEVIETPLLSKIGLVALGFVLFIIIRSLWK